ncbi:anion permease [candidate division WOR-3 bacterium]|nr:anion permease [candidate division WOR-3 bacterium]
MKKWVSIGIAVVLALVVYFAPFKGLTEPARRTFVILIVAATLWITEAIPLYATSLLIALLEVLLLKNVLNIQQPQKNPPRYNGCLCLSINVDVKYCNCCSYVDSCNNYYTLFTRKRALQNRSSSWHSVCL